MRGMSGDYVDRKIIFKFFLEALIDPLSLFLLSLGLRLARCWVDTFRFTALYDRHNFHLIVLLNFNIEIFYCKIVL